MGWAGEEETLGGDVRCVGGQSWAAAKDDDDHNSVSYRIAAPGKKRKEKNRIGKHGASPLALALLLIYLAHRFFFPSSAQLKQQAPDTHEFPLFVSSLCQLIGQKWPTPSTRLEGRRTR